MLAEVGPLGDDGTILAYDSDGFSVTGALFEPAGEGPFPAVVLVHGFIDESFTTGSELVRERTWLVQRGYVVFAPDLRSAGGSDVDPASGTDLEMGWTVDVINALRALAADPRVDSSRIVLMGHSLGGLVALNAAVVAPETAVAVVALAPSSTDLWDNITRFLAPGDEVWDALVGPRGTPEENPQLWADVSPRTFVERATAPVLIVQGTADDVVDPSWAAATADSWHAAGGTLDLVEIDGADHAFDPHWDEAMAAIGAFLAATVPG